MGLFIFLGFGCCLFDDDDDDDIKSITEWSGVLNL